MCHSRVPFTVLASRRKPDELYPKCCPPFSDNPEESPAAVGMIVVSHCPEVVVVYFGCRRWFLRVVVFSCPCLLVLLLPAIGLCAVVLLRSAPQACDRICVSKFMGA